MLIPNLAIAVSAVTALVAWSPGHSFSRTEAVQRDLFIQTSSHVKIHVRIAGAEQPRHTLILIPGWRLTASIWGEQFAYFSKERRVIVVDPRSQGDSTKTAEGDTPEQRARDLNVIMRQLSAGPTVLVGWSQGVQDVTSYIDQFGTKSLAGIVLVDSTVSRGADAILEAPQFAARQLGLLALYADDPAAYTRGMMRAIIKKPLSPADLDDLVAAALKTPTAIGEAMLVADLFGIDRTPALAKFDRPTLVIASASSAELEAQKVMAASLPQGHLEIMQDAGHAVFVDQPDQFDRLLAAFLSRTD